MKRTILVFAAVALCLNVAAQSTAWKKVEASSLNLCGKAFETPNPYHRIDTCVYKGFTPGENRQCRVPAGLTVLFRTDARSIGVSMEFGWVSKDSYNSYRGFDLYIKKDGKWLWAGTTSVPSDYRDKDRIMGIISDMAPGEKECLLYLPLYSELYSCQVCVPEGSMIEPLDSPFKHKIVLHGSSFTHCISCSRSGMSYSM